MIYPQLVIFTRLEVVDFFLWLCGYDSEFPHAQLNIYPQGTAETVSRRIINKQMASDSSYSTFPFPDFDLSIKRLTTFVYSQEVLICV